MEYLKLNQVIETNRNSDVKATIERALAYLAEAQKQYPTLILRAVNSGNLARQIDLTQKEMLTDPTASVTNPLAAAAGAYFLNENIIAGSREPDVISYTNTLGTTTIPGWKPRRSKIKLGPGIGFVEAPSPYEALIKSGIDKAALTVNYTAPFGTAETRSGVQTLMDSRIDPEGKFFPNNGIFLTQGATEGVDLFMEAMAQLKPGSRVVFLGLSYYTGPFSAIQKNLILDRLIANPIKPSAETKFFPPAVEIKTALPSDTSALIITNPNNPNGEELTDFDIREIIKLAKKKGVLILYDCLFENMYFDPERNYQSRFLEIAAELSALDNIVVVDGLSKSRNFPGERIGFLATTNQPIITNITNIVLARRCNPRLPLGPLVQFEGLARQTKALQAQNPNMSLKLIAEKAMQNGNYPFSREKFAAMYQQWNQWDQQVLRFYQDNLTIVKAVLDGSVEAWSPDTAAFNTFVKLADIAPGTNCIDFLAKLMFTMATYTQVGPCFGISQKIWDEKLGLWPRITYACSRGDLIEGLARLIVFSRFYAENNFGDPNQFPTLDICYENQL
jgi:aspartate/methionine/tyrosine aminotransferase